MSSFDHSELVGLPDARLLELAPAATHQHFKGGLYQLLSVSHFDSETGEEVRAADGSSMILYRHVFPHAVQIWRRPASEFYGEKDHGRPRFRELGR